MFVCVQKSCQYSVIGYSVIDDSVICYSVGDCQSLRLSGDWQFLVHDKRKFAEYLSDAYDKRTF